MKQPRPTQMGLLPLVVGVTGHRDLADEDSASIVHQVGSLFATLRRSYPHTPIVLLSSLAEGADRLVARAALDCGVELHAVLPMQAELYELDFKSAQSLEDFGELLSRSYDTSVVPLNGDPADADTGVGGSARDHRYATAGAFIVSHSHVLIALWDGSPDEMPGGTSQIVRFALQGVPSKYLSGPKELRTDETGAVYHVRTARQSATRAGSPVAATWLYPGDNPTNGPAGNSARAAFEENLRSLERFNRDAVTSPIDRQANRTAESLLPAQRAGSFGAAGPILEYTRALFGQADALALRCRNSTHAAMISIFCTIGVAAVFFSLFANLFPGSVVLYFCFLVLVAIALVTNALVERSRLQDRFQDYRALAEGLRVQFYWRLAGINESVYDHYLPRQEGELEWIRDAMRAARFRRQTEPNPSITAAQTHALMEVILAEWIDDQGAYFSRACRKEREMATRIKFAARLCLAGTAIIAIALAATLIARSTAYQSLLVMLLTLMLAGAGLFTGYAQKRAHEEHARRYERMSALFKIAGERVELLLAQKDPPSARNVLMHLGREALAETCDWLILHREREIEVPTA